MRYREIGVGLLRESRFPIGSLASLPPANADDIGGWRAWLAQVTADESFAEALEFASPDLGVAVAEIVSAEQSDARTVRRAAESVLRYVLRARYRATPFGLFAQTAPVRFGEAELRLGTDEVLAARPDEVWLGTVLDELHGHPAAAERLRVVLDPTCVVVGSRVVVPYVPGETRPDKVEARATGPMRHVMELAGRPIDVADLADKLHAAYPDVERSVALAMIAGLMRSRILHSNLRPSSMAPDPLKHVLGALDAVGLDLEVPRSDLTPVLREISAAMDDHAGASGAERRHVRAQIGEQMSTVVGKRARLAIDAYAHTPVTIPASVAQDVAGALSIMAKISPDPGGTSAWAEYRRAFVETYSFGTLVPLADLLDPAVGLGFPSGYRDSARPAASAVLTSRDEHLLARVQEAVRDGVDEILLTDQDVAGLQVDEPDQVWASAEATVTLLAATTDALNMGDYRVLVDGMSSSAGVLTGRFLPLLDHAERERVLTAFRDVPTLDSDAVRVQVCSPPLRRRVQNVARSLRVADEVLAVGEHVDGATMHLDELAVGATRTRLYLVHRPTGRRIEPFVMNAVEPTHVTHPVVRFLCELPRSHAARLASFAWGAATGLPFRPRVRTGRVVLFPATWRLTRDDVATGLDSWQQRWSVPDLVFAGTSDRRLRLDLTVPAHRRMLTEQAKASGSVTVSEAPADTDFGWLGRAGQVTIPFVAEQEAAREPGLFAGPVAAGRRDVRLPGASSSTMLRIDTATRRAVEVFASGLAEVLDQDDVVERWWFTRYNDPHPHLRVRVSLHDRDQFGRLAGKVGAWAEEALRDGAVAGISWTTDRPENGRYGTGHVLNAAEHVFAADSQAALLQDLPGRDPDEREALLAVSLLDITNTMLGEADGPRFLVDYIDRSEGTASSREALNRARALARTDALAALGDLVAGSDLKEAWERRRIALRTYVAALESTGGDVPNVLTSLLHMHHVRAWGLDSDHEHAMRRLARATALSLLAKRTGATR